MCHALARVLRLVRSTHGAVPTRCGGWDAECPWAAWLCSSMQGGKGQGEAVRSDLGEVGWCSGAGSAQEQSRKGGMGRGSNSLSLCSVLSCLSQIAGYEQDRLNEAATVWSFGHFLDPVSFVYPHRSPSLLVKSPDQSLSVCAAQKTPGFPTAAQNIPWFRQPLASVRSHHHKRRLERARQHLSGSVGELGAVRWLGRAGISLWKTSCCQLAA